MNIAFGFEIFYPEKNGIITATIDLAKALINKGHNVYFFIPDNGVIEGDTIEYGIKVCKLKGEKSKIYAGMLKYKYSYQEIADKFKELNIDVIHLLAPGRMAKLLSNAATINNTCVVATHHTLMNRPVYVKYGVRLWTLAFLLSKASWRILFDSFYKKTWVITAPAYGTVDEIKAVYKKADVRYASNGINIDKFNNKIDESLLDLSFINDETFIFVGRVGLEKSIDKTVKAFKILLSKKPNAKLAIIGNGPYFKKLNKLIKKLNLENNVKLYGSVDNYKIINSGILKKCYAFVTASITENQSMTVIEAMISGLPVITADVPNMTKLVKEERGYFFKPKDINDLALTMEKALNDKNLRDKKAKECLNAINEFDANIVVDDYIKIYEDVLNNKKNGATYKSTGLR